MLPSKRGVHGIHYFIQDASSVIWQNFPFWIVFDPPLILVLRLGSCYHDQVTKI